MGGGVHVGRAQHLLGCLEVLLNQVLDSQALDRRVLDQLGVVDVELVWKAKAAETLANVTDATRATVTFHHCLTFDVLLLLPAPQEVDDVFGVGQQVHELLAEAGRVERLEASAVVHLRTTRSN